MGSRRAVPSARQSLRGSRRLGRWSWYGCWVLRSCNFILEVAPPHNLTTWLRCNSQRRRLGRVQHHLDGGDEPVWSAAVDELPAAARHALTLHRVGEQNLDRLPERVR